MHLTRTQSDVIAPGTRLTFLLVPLGVMSTFVLGTCCAARDASSHD